jgi:hypothetical protein
METTAFVRNPVLPEGNPVCIDGADPGGPVAPPPLPSIASGAGRRTATRSSIGRARSFRGQRSSPTVS